MATANELFKGVIKLDVRDSKPDWAPFELKHAPKGAPNILIVLYDDTGLAAWSPFGGRINMPTLQRLADNGLRFYYPDTEPVPESVAVSIRGRSYKIIADVEITHEASGVIFAHGSRFGGHALFIKDRMLYYVYNFLGINEQKFVSKVVNAGKHTLGMEFMREKAGEYSESVGTTRLYVDGKVVAEGPMKTQAGMFSLSGDGLCVGFDSGDNVSQEYKIPGRFTGGTILGVAIDVSEEVYLDMEKEAAGALARD